MGFFLTNLISKESFGFRISSLKNQNFIFFFSFHEVRKEYSENRKMGDKDKSILKINNT